jgi:hypothetical protein
MAIPSVVNSYWEFQIGTRSLVTMDLRGNHSEARPNAATVGEVGFRGNSP